MVTKKLLIIITVELLLTVDAYRLILLITDPSI